MKKLVLAFSMAAFVSAGMVSCTGQNEDSSSDEIENTDVVPSGTYNGTAHRVDADEKEVYLKTDDGKMLELYFTDNTVLNNNGMPASFDALQQGQQLQVTVEKKGNRLEPVSVNIVQ